MANTTIPESEYRIFSNHFIELILRIVDGINKIRNSIQRRFLGYGTSDISIPITQNKTTIYFMNSLPICASHTFRSTSCEAR